MSETFLETPVIREFLGLEVEETGDANLSQIVRLRCKTAVGELTIRISPTAAGYLGKALTEEPLTRGYA